MNNSRNLLSLNLFLRKGTKKNCEDPKAASIETQKTCEEPLSNDVSKDVTLDKRSSCVTPRPLPTSLQPPPCDYIFICRSTCQASGVGYEDNKRRLSEHRCDVDVDTDDYLDQKKTTGKDVGGLDILPLDSFSVLTCEEMTTSSQSSLNKKVQHDRTKKQLEENKKVSLKGSKTLSKFIWI
jgi:hypothetical protein